MPVRSIRLSRTVAIRVVLVLAALAGFIGGSVRPSAYACTLPNAATGNITIDNGERTFTGTVSSTVDGNTGTATVRVRLGGAGINTRVTGRIGPDGRIRATRRLADGTRVTVQGRPTPGGTLNVRIVGNPTLQDVELVPLNGYVSRTRLRGPGSTDLPLVGIYRFDGTVRQTITTVNGGLSTRDIPATIVVDAQPSGRLTVNVSAGGVANVVEPAINVQGNTITLIATDTWSLPGNCRPTQFALGATVRFTFNPTTCRVTGGSVVIATGGRTEFGVLGGSGCVAIRTETFGAQGTVFPPQTYN